MKWGKSERCTPGSTYFSCIWYSLPRGEMNENYEFVVLEVGGKYYASPINEYTNKKDVGPFNTLTEAETVAETLMLLQTSVDDLSTSST